MCQVSVIIPTYRRPEFLRKAIESVLRQTFRDFELIVVDDFSGGNTSEVVRTFTDTRIRFVQHKTRRGGAVARNTGIGKAQGKYIAFLDDDDEWLHILRYGVSWVELEEIGLRSIMTSIS